VLEGYGKTYRCWYISVFKFQSDPKRVTENVESINVSFILFKLSKSCVTGVV